MYNKPTFHSIFLNLTDACNMRCTYCFEHKKNHYMTLDIAKDSVKLLYEINKDNNEECGVNFFGGEPLLCWDTIIVPLVLWAESQNWSKKVTFGITSNGSLIDSDKIKFMVDHNISYMLSMDGDKSSQDACRHYTSGEMTFDTIQPYLNEMAEKLHPTFHGTITPATANKLWSNIQFSKQYGFRNAYFTPDWFGEWDEESINSIKVELHKYSLYYINCYKNHIRPYEFSAVTKTIQDLPTVIRYQKTHELPAKWSQYCGLCQHSACIDYDGTIYGCQQTPTLNVVDNIYKVGDIYQGIDTDKHKRLLDTYYNNSPIAANKSLCAKCSWKSICINRCCHSNCYITNGTLNTPPEISCVWYDAICREAIYISNILVAMGSTEFQEEFNIFDIIDIKNLVEVSD